MAWIGPVSHLQSQLAAPPFAALAGYLHDVVRPGAVSERLQTLAVGQTQRVELAGGAFALEQAYLTKRRTEGFFESHRRYIDIQVIVAGEEWMELAGLATMRVREPYNPDRDLLVFADAPEASRLHLGTGDAAVFFPPDVHMPGLCGAAGPALVRKTVVKVPVA